MADWEGVRVGGERGGGRVVEGGLVFGLRVGGKAVGIFVGGLVAKAEVGVGVGGEEVEGDGEGKAAVDAWVEDRECTGALGFGFEVEVEVEAGREE